MTSRAKRLTFILIVAALVAFVVGAVMVPDTVAAPKKPKPEPGDDTFTIQATRTIGTWAETAYFDATGAIEDSGSADFTDEPLVRFLGGPGAIHVDLHDDGTFTIVGGTGKYRRLSGGGTYTEEWITYGGDPPQWPEPPDDGVLAEATYVLEGSLDG